MIRAGSPSFGKARPVPSPGCALLLATAILVVVLAWHPINVGARLLLLMPEVFPNAPVRPLLALTGRPERLEVRYAGVEGPIVADLYLPASPGRHGAVLLCLGVNPSGRDEPILVRVAEALARIGLVVLIPESERLHSGKIDAAEIDDLVAGIVMLREHPAVDPERVGLAGFSVGGSLTLIAAADERIASKLSFVNAFGAYADAGELAANVATRSYQLDGEIIAWQPAPMAEQVVIDHIAAIAPTEAEQTIIREAVLHWRANDGGGGSAPPDASSLGVRSAAGEAALALLTAPTLPEAREQLTHLPEDARQRLQSVSPINRMPEITTRIFLMHDQSDPLVPFVDSRRLADAAPAGRVAYTEFSVFEHVEPTRAVDALTLAGEGGKLFVHLYLMLLPVL